jgi:acyl transferase domain-containing protein
VAQTITDALDLLSKCVRMLESTDGPETWSHPGGINYRSSAADLEGKVVALFPGQGSQYVNMGKELALTYPRIRTSFEKADAAFFQENGIRLSSTAFPIPVFSDEDRQKQKQALTRTLFAQPAIGTLSLAMYQILKEAGFSADHFAGHSFGELTALYAAEVYDEDAFIRLAIARGKAMETRPSSDSDTGTMIAVKGDIKKVQEIVSGQDSVTIANFNSTTQVVLAGSTAAIGSFKQKLENLGFSVYPLNVSAAFHTQFVAHAQAPFREAIRKETFAQPKHAVYSNSTGNQHSTDPQTIKENLENHILNAVKFKEEIEKIYNNRGRIFIEIGPKNILTNLVKEILADQPHETITLNPNPQKDSDLQFRQAIVMMRVLGLPLG